MDTNVPEQQILGDKRPGTISPCRKTFRDNKSLDTNVPRQKVLGEKRLMTKILGEKSSGGTISPWSKRAGMVCPMVPNLPRKPAYHNAY